MANRSVLADADARATAFPSVVGTDGVDPARVTGTGNPVRAEIRAARGDYPALSADTPSDLLVVGGSQSARVFGEVVPRALLALSPEIRSRLRVALQYKGDDADAIAARLREAGVAAEEIGRAHV